MTNVTKKRIEWEAIPGAPDAETSPLPAWQQRMIDKAVAEIEADPDSGILVEDLIAELRRRTPGA